jgi:hypothetical protein
MRAVAGMAALAAILVAAPAFAWEPSGDTWCDEDFPLTYCVNDPPGGVLPDGAFSDLVTASFEAWADAAPCAGLDPLSTGACDQSPGADAKIQAIFGDPFDVLDAGVFGLTVMHWDPDGGTCDPDEGHVGTRIVDAVIQLADDGPWVLDADIDAGQCDAGQTSAQAFFTHQLGHVLGLGHSCEQNEVCNDQDLVEATMFWSMQECDDHASSPNVDDIEGLNHLYGPHAEAVCDHEIVDDPDGGRFGIVPWTLRCHIVSNAPADITGVTWRWGDGAVSEGIDVAHEYTTEGNFSLTVTVDGVEACGAWTSTMAVRDILSCDVPRPEFSVERVDRLTYQLRNDTAILAFGCLENVQWDVFAAGGTEPIAQLPAWSPKFTFPEPGEYRIVLNLGGPAGTAAAELTMTAESRRGEGYGACSTAPAGLGAIAALACLLALRRRRR